MRLDANSARCAFLFLPSFVFGISDIQPTSREKAQVDAITAEYNTVKEKHTAAQTALTSAEDLLQTLLTGLAGTSPQSAGGGRYMGQIADARTQLAQAAAGEEQARVKLDMSRRELGELENRWKAVEREASQGERDIKKMQAKSRVCGRKWMRQGGAQRRSRRVRRRCEEQKKTRCTVHRYMFDLSHTCTELDGNGGTGWLLAVRSRLSQLDFNYAPPPGFDTRKVKGLFASLLALKPEDHRKSTVLEIAAR
jgi:structural maintenance of chromosome 2